MLQNILSQSISWHNDHFESLTSYDWILKYNIISDPTTFILDGRFHPMTFILDARSDPMTSKLDARCDDFYVILVFLPGLRPGS